MQKKLICIDLLQQLHQESNGDTRIASMPYEITRYSNGLVISDLLPNKEKMLVSSKERRVEYG